MNCRHCSTPLSHALIDLGHQPPSNAYLGAADLHKPEMHAPLKAFVCGRCWLVQLPAHHQADELFTADYGYFSSVSTSWVEHASRYVDAMRERFSLGARSLVVEIASNDGYLLQFVRNAGIPCIGVEPTASTAAAARAKGIETLEVFFGAKVGRQLAQERRPADLITANNVLAHVPDINDFVAGFRELLAPEGVATFEFPHLMKLIDGCQFDTIYHEHYSYLSFSTVRTILQSQGLRVFDVEEIPTHGGSLRVFACHENAKTRVETPGTVALWQRERQKGVTSFDYYAHLQARADRIKLDLIAFIVEQKRAGRTVAGYGAAAKGNTLLNYAGIRPDLFPFVCDAGQSKQGRFLPGSHVPIVPPAALAERRPDFVLILPWNIRNEIMAAHAYVRDWRGRFVIAVPRLEVI